MKLSSAQLDMLLDMHAANEEPREPWENYDPDFPARTAAILRARGLIETKTEGGYTFHRLTPKGRAYAETRAFKLKPAASEGGAA